MDLKQENYSGSHHLAYKTINTLRKLITQLKWSNAKELMDEITNQGKQMIAVQPTEYVVGNMVRRVLKIIREEYVRLLGKSEESANKDSLHKMLVSDSDKIDYKKSLKELQSVVMEAVNEYIDEIEASIHNIASQAIEHIHSNEVVLTIGKSRTVESFLKQAAKKRKFHVIVVEGAPQYQGHDLAKSLAEKNIETTVITDSAVFAMMSRVNKVIIGTHSVLANGGLRAVHGAHMVALAAQEHSVPLIVLGSLFKLTPFHYSDIGNEATFNRLSSPEGVMSYYDGGEEDMRNVQIYSPTFDFVPPELVTLFISNIGGVAPSYIYRLLSELYHADDQDLSNDFIDIDSMNKVS